METASSETSSTIFSFFTILQNTSASFYPVLITSGILLIFSGLISGSEVAFFSLTPAQLKACSESQSSTERQIVVLLKKPKLLLACILILNNTVNTAIVTICTFAMWEIYGKDNNLAVVVLTFIITVVILFFGEILPKIFATRSNIMFARNMVRVWLFLTTMLAPLATSLTIIGDWVERKYKKKGYKVTADELNVAVEMTIGHETTEKEKEILKGIVNFGSKSVRQIMQVRVDIFAVNKKIDFHELMDKINKNAYSRIPVFEETLDKIIGIIYVKDLLPYINESENFDWQSLIDKEVFFVPENKRIDELLRDFQARRVHLAIVVDEYGGTSGLITMEDIIEEIVGDINDEFDFVPQKTYEKIDDKTYRFDAKISLNDFCKVLNLDDDYFNEVKGESESLGGLMLELFSKIPHPGASISYKNFSFTIVSVNKKRIKSVKVVEKNQDKIQEEKHSTETSL